MSSIVWQAILATCLSDFIYCETTKTFSDKRDFQMIYSEAKDIPCSLAESTREAVFFPHPSDCQLYYICDSGFLRLLKCQPGLHFNPSLRACDYPEEAGCDKATLKPKGKLIDEEFGVCPSRNSKSPVLLPHPTECTKFYICDNGSPHLQVCQAGLHFNQALKACDYPGKAGCGKDVTEKPEDKWIEDDEDSSICPISNSKHPILLPHPTDCNKFFICDNGSPHLKICHSGLHFNPKQKTCDFPKNSGCDEGITSKPKGRNGDDDLEVCPDENFKFPVFVPHPTDCRKFFICDSGSPHLKTCQPGLHFNLKLKSCDYPENAGCEMSDVMTGFSSPFCPPVNGRTPFFYRHTSNCSVYYMCSHGSAYEFVCPARLHFNLRRKVCDYETESRCTSNN